MLKWKLHALSLLATGIVVLAIYSSTIGLAPEIPIQGIASFVGDTSDYGNDTNEDGIYEYLTVNYTVGATEPGDFMVRGQLYGHKGLNMDDDENLTTSFTALVSVKSVEMMLTAGTHNLSMSFHTYMIYNSNQTMSWNVDLSLYNFTSMELLDNRTHTTSEYSYTLFEKPGLKTSSIVSHGGQDVTQNGYYDTLTVSVSFQVNKAGNYYTSAGLYDNTNTQLYDINYQSGSYSTGPTTLVFNFNVSAYGGSSGPYPVTVFVRDDLAQWEESPLRIWEDYVVETCDLTLNISSFEV